MTFETSKFPIVFVRLILRKVRVDRFTGPRRKIGGRYEFACRVNLRVYRANKNSNRRF